MEASGADKLILLVQTNQVLYDKSAALKRVIFGRLVLILLSIVSVLLIYAAVSHFSFLGGGVTAPSDFSFLVSRFSFLVPRFSFLGGGVTGPLLIKYCYSPLFCVGTQVDKQMAQPC